MLWILRTLCPLRLMLPAVFLAAVSLASVSALSAQETPAASAGQDNQKAYARSPKDIVFQNDSQWEDNRWQRTEVGPFLCGTIRAGRATTLKGIAIRVGDSGEAGVLFDTARLRVSAAWTGEFLKFGPRRFGLIAPPQAGGEIAFSTAPRAGWSREGRFDIRPDEITQPGLELQYPNPAVTETHLPTAWAHYKGLSISGQRVVLAYTVGSAHVLESPWFVSAAGGHAFVRSFEIRPSPQPMELWVADADSVLAVVPGNSQATLSTDRPVLTIPPHRDTIRLKALIAPAGTSAAAMRALRETAGDPENLTDLTQRDAGRFPQVLTTRGSTTQADAAWVVDTLTLPFENPWNALLFTAGHDFFSDGRAAVCTAHGDVWTVSGIDDDLQQLQWRRFATGLCQPLGLRIVDDTVFVVGRNQVTRLHDRNGDGEADYQENFNNDLVIAPMAHDYVTCLETDEAGRFYFIHARTGVMRLSADGRRLTSVADGFRNPNGLGVGPGGMITAAPQQGQWTPESSLIAVRPGGYYGYGGPRVTPERPAGWELPMCFIPREMDNSGGGQVWVTSQKWGPLSGSLLHLSYGQCRLLLAVPERVGTSSADPVSWQGGTIAFPTTPADFESGIMRGRFSPHDGQLYVSGLRGWQTRAIRDGCLQRVRYTGREANLPVGVRTYANGIRLTFTEPLDRAAAEDPDNYFAQQWNYRWSASYGSPEFSVKDPGRQGRDEVAVVSATLLPDGRSVFLEMPGRQPVHQIVIDWLLKSAQQTAFRGRFAHTINVAPREAFPEADLVRRTRQPVLAEEVVARLEPGLRATFRVSATGDADVRVSRLAALRQSLIEPPTPFLSPGPFQVQLAGTIRIPRSGFYEFRLQSSGPVRGWLNDVEVLTSPDRIRTVEPVLLRKGHNRLRVEYTTLSAGSAHLELQWRGHGFDWEPVPPNVLFHDPVAPGLQRAQLRRLGRTRFAENHCVQCHDPGIELPMDQPGMPELTAAPPDLNNAGLRFEEPWLRQWIFDPASLRADAHMPAMLSDDAVGRQQAADLAAWLSTAAVKPSVPDSGADDHSAKRIAAGEELFESLNCLVCHRFGALDQDDAFERISLHSVSSRYRPGALAEFLRDPTASHAATRMPDFRLTADEAASLAAYVRSRSTGRPIGSFPTGDADRGRALFASAGCVRCHARGPQHPVVRTMLPLPGGLASGGCLSPAAAGVPRFRLSAAERQALAEFVRHDLKSLERFVPVEAASRLVGRLRCTSCHDQDGRRSPRNTILQDEGSGRAAELIPALTWAGDKFHAGWTEQFLAGAVRQRPRPWLRSRMPAFPSYAAPLAAGLARQHAVEPQARPSMAVDPELVRVGEQLTRQTALDCRQCHAIGDQQPRGDEKTQVALGINFTLIRDRLRHETYHRFMLNPARFDASSRMIRLSEDGRTTKLKQFYDADAQRQFEAIWHYIQSLPDDGARQPWDGGSTPNQR